MKLTRKRDRLEYTETELIIRLLSDRIRQLNSMIRTADNLSNPVPDGHWRWADVKGAYGHKSEAELALDRAGARMRAQRLRDEQAVAVSAIRKAVRL